jgi:hypothetical protein
MIDLGLVIKAQAVIDVINACLGKWARNSARTIERNRRRPSGLCCPIQPPVRAPAVQSRGKA